MKHLATVCKSLSALGEMMISSTIPRTVKSSKKKMDNDIAESHLITNLYTNKIPIYPEWDMGCSETVSVTFSTVC